MPGRPVYSTVFMAIRNVTGSTTYAVPDGHTAILHHCSLWIPDSFHLASQSVMTVALDDSGIYVWDVAGPNAVHGIYQWAGREVFTDTLYAYGWPYPYSFRASGYLVTNA